MDIYSYLNSKDVADHCRSIGHQFNTMEAAFIINSCHRLSVREKHAAFRELMETMPDMQLPEKLSYMLDDLGLFHSLEAKMKAEDKFLDMVQNGSKGMVYSYSVYDSSTKRKWEGDKLFSSYQNAYEDAVSDIEDELILIRAEEIDSGAYIKCYLNREREIAEIAASDSSFNNATTFFDDIWVYIPTPFKKGDLLYIPVRDISMTGLWSDVPMVLTRIDYWERDEEFLEYRRQKGDATDMIAFGYWMDGEDQICYECCHAYQDLEYYRGEIVIRDSGGRMAADYRLLQAISAFIKDRISVDVLLAANNLIRSENQMRKPLCELFYFEKACREAGIGDIWERWAMLGDKLRGKV